MQITALGSSNYLFINGLSIEKELVLTEHLSLLPAKPDVSPELCLSLGKTPVEAAVITIFLPHVRSQFLVHGLTGKVAATVAWNSIWDIFFIGAVVDCEAMSNLQSDVSADCLNANSQVAVTNYQFRGFPRSEPRSISDDEAVWITRHLGAGRSLMDDDRYRNAVHSLSNYRWHSIPAVQLAILWSGIESLFSVDSELVFRISLYIALFLEPDNRQERMKIFGEMKELYKARSKAVHGGKIKQDAHDLVKRSAATLRALVMRCAENGQLPSVSDLIP